MGAENTKCVIYARVSSREQEESGYSLDAQIEFLREYVAKRNLTTIKVFRVTESASKYLIRKTLSEMLTYCDKYNVGLILCEKIDRLTRSMKDATIVDEWVREKSIREVHFVKESFVLSEKTKAHENFVWDMKVATARFYTNNLSEEVRKGQNEKIRQGWFPARSPLGYKSQGEAGHKTHVIDLHKAHHVRRAFEMYATGNYSLSALRDHLFADGLRTHQGARLSKSRLADILGDPYYYGAIRWNENISQGKHEPMVSKELWDRVQSVLRGKTTPHHRRHEFTFTKRITCGECGGTISGEIQKGHIYYSCKHTKNCSQKGMTREEEIEKTLMGVFKLFESVTPAEAEEIYKRIRANHAAESEYKESALASLQTRYNALQRQVGILYDDRLAERISQIRWTDKQAQINAEQTAIQADIDRIKQQETKYFELYINILDLARRASEIYAKRTPAQRRLLLANIFSNLTLKDKKVSYVLSKPIEVLSRRIQERLDAEKDFEPGKRGSTKAKAGAHAPAFDSLLRG